MPAQAHRYIDAITRDYVAQGGGLRGDTGFTSKVVLALSTRLGSCVFFPEFGSRLHEVKVADERGRKLAEKYTWQALQHIADQIDSLDVSAALVPGRPGVIQITVSGTKGSTTDAVLYTAAVGGNG